MSIKNVIFFSEFLLSPLNFRDVDFPAVTICTEGSQFKRAYQHILNQSVHTLSFE